MTGPHDGAITIDENLRLDEEALRRAAIATRAASLHLRSLSIGVAVRAEAEWVENARRRGIPIVRRSTGGTGVLHEVGDLLWSVVLPRGDPRVGRDYARAYARFGEGARRFLVDLGLDAHWSASPARSESCCTLGSRGCVLTVEGRVVGGAAQHLTRTALLHHGTISCGIDRNLVRELFDLASPADADLLTGIGELGIDRTSADLVARLAASMRASFE